MRNPLAGLKGFLGDAFGHSLATSYPLTLKGREQASWKAMVKGEDRGHNDVYFCTMALAYACATKKLDSAEFLMKNLQTPPSGCFGIPDNVLFAMIDYNDDGDDQVAAAKLLNKYGVNFNAYDLDKHDGAISDDLRRYMRSDLAADRMWVKNHLEDAPFISLPPSARNKHVNVLALSYAMLNEMPAEAEFLIKVRQTPVSGTVRLVEEPLKAAKLGGSERMMEIIQSYGVGQSAYDPTVRQPR